MKSRFNGLIGIFVLMAFVSCATVEDSSSSDRGDGVVVKAIDYYDHSVYLSSELLDEVPLSFRLVHKTDSLDNTLILQYESAGEWVTAGEMMNSHMGLSSTNWAYLCITGAEGGSYVYIEIDVYGDMVFSGNSDAVKIRRDDDNSWSASADIAYDADSFTLITESPGTDGCGWMALPDSGGADYYWMDPTSDWTITWEIEPSESGWAGINLTYDDEKWSSVSFVVQY